MARTNLLGALLCTRAAIKVMEYQERVGHVFNMDGAGMIPSFIQRSLCCSGECVNSARVNTLSTVQ